MNQQIPEVNIYELDSLLSYYKRLGSPEHLPITYRGQKITILMNPDVIRQVLNDTGNFIKSSGIQAGFESVIGKGILTRDASEWETDRAIFGKYFRGQPNDSEQQFSSAVETFTKRVMQNPRARDLHTDIAEQSLEITLSTFFASQHVSARDFPVSAFNKIKSIIGATVEQTDETQKAQRVELLQSLKTYFQFIKDLAERESATDSEADAITAIKNYSDYAKSDVIGQISNLFAASYDTTKSGSFFVMAVLAQHPQWQEKIHQELLLASNHKTPDLQVIKNCKALSAVVFEALRLYPSIWGISRCSVKNRQIGDISIPAESEVTVVPYLLHRCEKHWQNADQFNPNRFIGDGSRLAGAPFYMPFSKGPRACIGMGFALNAIKFTIARLICAYRFQSRDNKLLIKATFPFLLDTKNKIKIDYESRSAMA